MSAKAYHHSSNALAHCTNEPGKTHPWPPCTQTLTFQTSPESARRMEADEEKRPGCHPKCNFPKTARVVIRTDTNTLPINVGNSNVGNSEVFDRNFHFLMVPYRNIHSYHFTLTLTLTYTLNHTLAHSIDRPEFRFR